LRLCCNSYFNVARPWVIFLPSSCFSGSVSTEVARWTSSIAPVCTVMRSCLVYANDVAYNYYRPSISRREESE
jgi:hypothetical protein